MNLRVGLSNCAEKKDPGILIRISLPLLTTSHGANIQSTNGMSFRLLPLLSFLPTLFCGLQCPSLCLPGLSLSLGITLCQRLLYVELFSQHHFRIVPCWFVDLPLTLLCWFCFLQCCWIPFQFSFGGFLWSHLCFLHVRPYTLINDLHMRLVYV